jgi:hypothetical protein
MSTEGYEVIIDSENPFQRARLERIRMETSKLYKKQVITAFFGIAISVFVYYSQEEYKYEKVGFVFGLTIVAILVESKLSNINESIYL